jgi:hypothetical protein
MWRVPVGADKSAPAEGTDCAPIATKGHSFPDLASPPSSGAFFSSPQGRCDILRHQLDHLTGYTKRAPD